MRIPDLFLSFLLLFVAGPLLGEVREPKGLALASPEAGPEPNALPVPVPRRHISSRRRPILLSSRRRHLAKVKILTRKSNLHKAKKALSKVASRVSTEVVKPAATDLSRAASLVTAEKLVDKVSAAVTAEQPETDEDLEQDTLEEDTPEEDIPEEDMPEEDTPAKDIPAKDIPKKDIPEKEAPDRAN